MSTDTYKRGDRVASAIADMSSHIQYLQEQLSQLTPPQHLRTLLQRGKITTQWYAQRLSDMGMTLQEISDDVNTIRDMQSGSNVAALSAEWQPAKLPPWRERVRVGRRKKPATPTHTSPSHASIRQRSVKIDNGVSLEPSTQTETGT